MAMTREDRPVGLLPPADPRTVMVERALEGEDVETIGRRLGLSSDAVVQGLRDAQATLGKPIPILRRYVETDFPALVGIVNDIASEDQHYNPVSEEVVRGWFQLPEADLTQYGWVIETSAEIVGWLAIWTWPRLLQAGRVEIAGGVRSERRRRGYGTMLIRLAERLAREAGARYVLAMAPAERAPTSDFLTGQHGFTLIRCFFRLRLGSLEGLPISASSQSFTIRPLAGESELGELVQVHNAAFRSEFGHVDLDAEGVKGQLAQQGATLSTVLVAADAKDQLLGYCGYVRPEAATATAANTGFLTALAVRPDYQGHGIGRALLLKALATLRQLGATAAEIAVDGA
ncbi:MAG: GNAT family N-acetyltransferase, partial [Chloroflexi bacterium]|nr:GNAT family N-acetyltransferase [Chloroflexota bacterium]